MIDVGLTVIYHDRKYIRVIGITENYVHLCVVLCQSSIPTVSMVKWTMDYFLQYLVATQQNVRAITTSGDVSSYFSINPSVDDMT